MEAVAEMQSDFLKFWGSQAASTSVFWDQINENTDQPFPLVRNVEKVYAGSEAYIEVALRHNAPTKQVALGRRKFDHYGLIIVSVYGEQNLARSRGPDLIADQALRYFQLASDGVSYTNSQASEVGKSGNWYKINVLSEFLYQVTRQPITEVN